MKYRQQTYLLAKNSSATSYVAATFHPTIGQRAHQSLSNAATPELGMIPPRIRVNAGLHIAEGHNQRNQHCWVYQDINNRPSQHSSKTSHYSHAAKQSLHSPVKKAKTTDDSPKRKVRHSSSLQGNSELFLALTWPKQLSCNPKPGYFSSHKHTMNYSSNP